MPVAICPVCDVKVDWRNARGSRLSDLRCPKCGGPVKRATRTNEGWVVGTTTPGTAGRKFVACALCGRNRMAPGGGIRLREATTYQVWWAPDSAAELTPASVSIPAGTVVCWHHEPGYPVPGDKLPRETLESQISEARS
jgi:hypothetical protein